MATGIGTGLDLGGNSRGGGGDPVGGGGSGGGIQWEMRPSGMLVQKRPSEDEDPPPPVTVRVRYGAFRYNITLSSRANFGELKRLLSTETGLQIEDQRMVYKGKVRQNAEYLDVCGVRNRSKVLLEENPCSLERRYVQMQRTAKTQRFQKAISDVSMEIDKLADEVTAIEKSVSSRIKVAEVQITTLTELFMGQAIKLDSINAQGVAASQKILQAKRVQKCVETLDVLKVSNARLNHVVSATKWETFESPFSTRWEFFE